MATKTPHKGKKAAPKKKEPGRAKAAKASPPKPEDEDKPEGAEAEGGDDDEEDEDDQMMKAAAKKPLKPSQPKSAQQGEEQPAVVPARRLTPEAKAKVNQMVAKGMSLTEALKIAASWETFVAPVKDEPAKLVQGRSFEGGGRPRQPRNEEDERPEPHDIEEEEPAATEAEE
jgi:hypothetical protein